MQSRRALLLCAALALAGACPAPARAAAPPAPASAPPLRPLTALEKQLPRRLQDILAHHLPGYTPAAARKLAARARSVRKGAAAPQAQAAPDATAAAAAPAAPLGSSPQGLVQGSDGSLYGAAMTGGANNNGVLFRLTLTTVRGKTVPAYSVLYNFSGLDSSGHNADGAYPIGSLVEDRNSPGTFYGATYQGGAHGGGTVFRFAAATGALTPLHSFASGSPVPADGAYPVGSLVQAQDGGFYGTTFFGGYPANDGTMYKVTPPGGYQQLHVFTYGGGVIPSALVEDTASPGTFYGTTQDNIVSGPQIAGSVFKATAAGAVTFLHLFTNPDGSANAQGYSGTNAEGAHPQAGLLLASDGNFYGTATAGGLYGSGTVFKMDRAGNVTAAYSFSGSDGDGANPDSALTEDRNNPGDLYGTVPGPGNDRGGVYALLLPFPNRTGTGSLRGDGSILHFRGDDGDKPYTGVIQAQDGTLYGTTAYGGFSLTDQGTGDGVIFGVQPSGAGPGMMFNLNTGLDLPGTGSTDGPPVRHPTRLSSSALGWVEQPRPGSQAQQYGLNSAQVGDYDWTGLTGVLNLSQYGLTDYTVYLGPSHGQPASDEEIDPDGYSTGGTWDLGGTSTFKWLWSPPGSDPSGVKNNPAVAATDPSQPYPAPPLYAVAVEAPYTDGGFFGTATGPQPKSAHGNMSDGFDTTTNRSFTGVPGAAPANSVSTDGTHTYINDLPRHFVVPAALEGDDQTAHGTISPSLHVDITDYAFEPESYVDGQMQAVVSRIEMTSPNVFGRPDLGDGSNQFSYDASAPGELDIPGEITPFGAFQDDVNWLADLQTLGPKPPSGAPAVAWRFDNPGTPSIGTINGYSLRPSAQSMGIHYRSRTTPPRSSTATRSSPARWARTAGRIS